MTVKAFEFRAGSSVGVSSDGDEAYLLGHSACRDKPDWVRLPEQLGGQRVPVTGQREDRCKKRECLDVHDVLELEAQHQGKKVAVMECPSHGFLWFTLED